jgi:hypothetical protein
MPIESNANRGNLALSVIRKHEQQMRLGEPTRPDHRDALNAEARAGGACQISITGNAVINSGP